MFGVKKCDKNLVIPSKTPTFAEQKRKIVPKRRRIFLGKERWVSG